MEIDIFPLPHRKEGIARNLDKGFLGILIITYVIAAFKTAQYIVGNDADKEFMCFLLTIPIFIGYYALFVLVCHGIKTVLYAYFKSHRKEWNSMADREEMEEHIAQNLGQIQKKVQEKTATVNNQKNAAPAVVDAPKTDSNVGSQSPEEVSVTPETLAKLQLKRDIQKAHDELEVFINQVQINRKQMNEAKVAREARKLEAILKYTRYTLMPHGFTDEELYQIEEAVKLLVEFNGVTRMEALSIGKKKELKQADLKNFCWNIAYQYGIDPKTTALFVLNLFYA
ncbi:hypothetical protein [Segatella maculosa]|uniref:Uncharacterized protein n=1 Tax=Segatella maculosa OT 289 TaxID=999422 RepID=H1HPM4_9BACT|nr:hypothetical protein [Segatella maculosa]EHO67821.1 hypothetical protein HMPREF9944_02118 [Segatella maculosa OT 289]